ncbi:Uncharacterised protein [Legionella quateirensis]|uniref:Uncharacterized protein n=1 Tax=Legionella quateirensis TaxID=45072 RepID=A0A378KTC0_9GAMM|nr:hypothetical protein Lqua_2798 [Legionella quateirensis]STY16851.1 Uncharacterised protein [Legionella quateirensis]
MAGVGFRINHVLGKIPLDCGYRYFYLGKGSFYKNNDEWLTTLYQVCSTHLRTLRLCSYSQNVGRLDWGTY